jgi:alpha/beta superfamily hydrolase
MRGAHYLVVLPALPIAVLPGPVLVRNHSEAIGETVDVLPEKSEAVEKLAKKLANQRNVVVEYKAIAGADHFFADHMPELTKAIDDYLNRALTATA